MCGIEPYIQNIDAENVKFHALAKDLHLYLLDTATQYVQEDAY